MSAPPNIVNGTKQCGIPAAKVHYAHEEKGQVEIGRASCRERV